MFQTGIRHESFFTWKHILEVVGSLVPFPITMILQQDCIINIYLGRMMRVLTMRLKMEIILSFKL